MRHILRITFCALLGLVLLRSAPAQVAISVTFAPPALPVYEQPVCPAEGFIWVPGYWAWDADVDDYYWIPGTWVMAPQVGLLWTPPWWGWGDGGYLFHDGYWASEVGFYGGINYGYGYFGEGFAGGRWDRDRFMYNRAVMNVNVTEIHNVYEDRTVIINNRTENRVSYNGGEGGVTARPSPRDERVANERHFPPAQPQIQHRQMARSNPQLRASANQGRPPVAATARPAEFSGHAVVPARAAGAPYHPPANRGEHGGNARPGNENRPGNANAQRGGEAARPGENPGANPTHARDLPQHQPTQIEGGANPAGNQKYEKQQEKLAQQQNKEHQKLGQQQQKEDQQAAKREMNQEKRQQIEQHHQQQTQQMEQRHQQQTEQVQRHAQQPPPQPRPQEHPQPRPQ
jgi:hypothetical protein